MSGNRNQDIVAFIDNRFQGYLGSTFFQNWKLLCENIRDAIDQRYRPGEQMTRQGMYWAVMRAQRDGFREGFTNTFGQAKPLFVYKKRRGVEQHIADRAQELMEDVWEDIDGLTKWLLLTDDAIDFGMAVTYTHWCTYGGAYEKPIIAKEAWGDMLEWSDEYDILQNQPEFTRIHPFNYRSDWRQGWSLDWEGCEWEWSLEDVTALLGNKAFDQGAVRRLLDKMVKGQVSTSQDFYNAADKSGGGKPEGPKVYPKEYWGDLRGVKGMERDRFEYKVITCEGEIICMAVNRLHKYRPFKRVRLAPQNDLPIGQHILSPTLPHQRQKNLTLNLAMDDITIRQHLGLAAKRSALENPNDLVNPEGARGVLWMKANAGVNDIPRFYADQASGVLRDALEFDKTVTERDLQMAGLPQQALGLNGGVQDGTATAARFLAQNANARSRSCIIWAVETGLKPIGKDLILLALRNRPPEDLKLSEKDLMDIWANNWWEASDVVTYDQTQQNMALANWGQVATQQMAQITGPDGTANHLVRFMKDLGAAMGIRRDKLDDYLPEGQAPQVGGKPQGAPAPRPAQPNPQMADRSPSQAPMTMEAPAPSPEEAENVMAA
jgi:hypothetical protein